MFVKASGSALVIALVLGCAANKSTTAGTSGPTPAASPMSISTLAGDYTLATVDGHALPFAPRGATGTAARSVVSGSFLVNANGTFRLETSYGAESGASSAATGTCYPEDGTMKMVWDGGGLTNLSVRGDTVLLAREGSLYGYLRKR